MKSIKVLLTVVCLTSSIIAFSQENTVPFPNDSTITTFSPMRGYYVNAWQIRTGVGWQGSPNMEMGLQRSAYAMACTGIGGLNYYISNGFSYRFNAPNELEQQLIVNPKVGADLMFMFLSVGGHLNYYTNFDDDAFGISPTFSLWLGNQVKIQYIENRIWGETNPLHQNIGKRGVMLIYGFNLREEDSRDLLDIKRD